MVLYIVDGYRSVVMEKVCRFWKLRAFWTTQMIHEKVFSAIEKSENTFHFL